MTALKNTFRVAIFDEFLDAFARIPRQQQKKVNKFMRNFRADPTSASINYEKISTFRDQNLRTVRIDQTYRAIVLKPETGNVYVLLWVDHHDKAMRWAENKRVEIHPSTGSLQVLTAVRATETVAPEPTAQPLPEPLFANTSDDDLLSIGVPTSLLPIVRTLRTEAALDDAAEQLPNEVFEALFFLNSGEPLEAIRQSMGLAVQPTVDPDDFEAALDVPASKRRFAVVSDDAALARMLDAPLDKWRVFLHPSQLRIVQAHYNGPARVLGGAGTGKTVVAMHRANHLLTNVFTEPDDRLLFTTFTRNLAQDIDANLMQLCGEALSQRIDVVHLDKWVSDYLKRNDYRHRVAYWTSPELKSCWETAMVQQPAGWTSEFFREEWTDVIQRHGCTSLDDYKRARRGGRGVRLDRKQRVAIWPVFEAYRNALTSKGLRENEDAIRDAIGLMRHHPKVPQYRAILVDEAQDMSTAAFELLRQIIPEEQPNDLFIVGDAHQRIYRRRVVLKRAGVNIVGRSKKLYINYRTTDEIRNAAVAFLTDTPVDDLDGGVDTNSRYKSLSHGSPPEIASLKSFQQEADRIATFVGQEDARNTCLVARTNGLVDQYEEAMKARGIQTYRLSRNEAEDHSTEGLRIATMHRVKGLEFDRLCIAGVNKGVVPLEVGDAHSSDVAVRESAEQRERALFYVALTRARREVLITSNGQPSPWLTPTT
jgi:hypothetical protein